MSSSSIDYPFYDPTNGGVEMNSTMNPGTKNYLRYYYIENKKDWINHEFVKALKQMGGIGTITKATTHNYEHILKQAVDYSNFCGGEMDSDYLYDSVQKNNVLFILSGTDDLTYILHSVITFKVEYVKQNNKNISRLNIDSFCSYQKVDPADIGVDNPGGRYLMNLIKNACKKSKINQIYLKSMPDATEWYKKQGFKVSSNSDSDSLYNSVFEVKFSPQSKKHKKTAKAGPSIVSKKQPNATQKKPLKIKLAPQSGLKITLVPANKTRRIPLIPHTQNL